MLYLLDGMTSIELPRKNLGLMQYECPITIAITIAVNRKTIERVEYSMRSLGF